MEQGKLVKGSRRLVGIAAGLMLVMGFLLVAQGFIDTKDYRDQVLRIIKQQTGQDVLIKGKITARLLPRPALYIPGIELRSEDPKDTSPTLTVQAVYINAAVLSLFSDGLQVSSLSLERPVIEISSGAKGVINWGWLSSEFFKPLLVNKNKSPSIAINIVDGALLFYSEATNKNISVRGVGANGRVGDKPELTGSFQFNKKIISFEVNAQANNVKEAANQLPLSISLKTNEDSLKLQGIMDLSEEVTSISGELNVSLADIGGWIKAPANASYSKSDALPVELSGKWVQKGWDIALENIEMDLLSSKGKGKIEFLWADKPGFIADVKFSTLNYLPWRDLADLVAEHMQIMQEQRYRDIGDQSEEILPADIKIDISATSEKLYVGGQEWKNANLSATMEDSAITINQFFIDLPDAATLTLFGIISQGNSRSLRFEGNMETQGKSLRNMLTIFDESAVGLPETGFGEFYMQSNIFVSEKQVRLSEADVILNELKLSGGMVAYFDKVPRIEADVRLRDINFDYFRDSWRDSQNTDSIEDFFTGFNKKQDFTWLKRLNTNVDFKVIVDGFTFLEREGESAAFRLFAQKGEFGIYNMRFYYPNDIVEASFNLNVKNDIPLVTFIFNSSQGVNTDYFTAVKKENEGGDVISLIESGETDEPDKEGDRWSTELIDVSWMEGYNASIDVSVGELTHRNNTLNRFKMRAQMRKNLLTIQSLSFGYWRGRCNVTGTIYGGRVPGLSLGFTLSNTDLNQVINSFSERDNISGRLGVSGTISTSGVNMHSWAEQANAKLVLNGVGVRVNGFNLQGVVDVVNISRTPADIVNNVNLVLPKGHTDFSMEGYLNIKNGIVRTPGITLRSKNIMGNLTGDLKLIPWTMKLSTLFQFPAITSETTPTMNVKLVGAVENPELHTDTDSLEAFVSKRIVGR